MDPIFGLFAIIIILSTLDWIPAAKHAISYIWRVTSDFITKYG